MGSKLSKNSFQNQEWRANEQIYDLGVNGDAVQVLLVDTSGNPLVVQSLSGAPVSGTKTVSVAGTAVQITATPTPCKGVWLSGDTVAGILLAVGDSAVKANASGQRGIIIIPGNDPVFLQVNDLSLLWVDAATSGGKLCYLYLT